MNTCMSGFYREGVPREEIEDLLRRAEAETGSRTEREESLKETQEIKKAGFSGQEGAGGCLQRDRKGREQMKRIFILLLFGFSAVRSGPQGDERM